jgi:hypothetical protein
MREVTFFDARNPYFEFQADSEDKHAQSTARVRELCDSMLSPMYREMIDCAQE